jgi:spore maturation protein CgeB
MRVLIHAHAYPGFLQAVYGDHPELTGLDYEAQFAALDRESHIGANSAWAEALSPLGYEVLVTVSNDECSQKTWAREHGALYGADSWRTEIAEAQVAWFRPDLLFFTSYEGLRPEWIDHLRDTYPGLALIGIWCGMPFGDAEIFGHFDLVLTCMPELDERFRSLGCTSRQLHHAFDPRVLNHVDADREPDITLSFVGQLIRTTDLHEGRVRQLERLAETIGISIFSSAYDLYSSEGSPRRAQQVERRLVRRLKDVEAIRRLPLARRAARRAGFSTPAVSETLRPHVRPAVYGLAMYRTLQRSQVTYNSHGGIAVRSASNRRLFEATGVGSCLLTDHKPNISTLFEADREVVTFSGTDDCIDKATWLLEHPRERAELARAGQRRTLAEHTYAQRAVELDSVVKDALKRGARVPA